MTEIMISPDAETGLSKNHRLVYKIVLEQGVGTHLAMTQLFELARLRQPAIGFTTVYRALTRLRDAGLVAEISLPGAECAVYEPTAPRTHTSAARRAAGFRTFRIPSPTASARSSQSTTVS